MPRDTNPVSLQSPVCLSSYATYSLDGFNPWPDELSVKRPCFGDDEPCIANFVDALEPSAKRQRLGAARAARSEEVHPAPCTGADYTPFQHPALQCSSLNSRQDGSHYQLAWPDAPEIKRRRIDPPEELEEVEKVCRAPGAEDQQESQELALVRSEVCAASQGQGRPSSLVPHCPANVLRCIRDAFSTSWQPSLQPLSRAWQFDTEDILELPNFKFFKGEDADVLELPNLKLFKGGARDSEQLSLQPSRVPSAPLALGQEVEEPELPGLVIFDQNIRRSPVSRSMDPAPSLSIEEIDEAAMEVSEVDDGINER